MSSASVGPALAVRADNLAVGGGGKIYVNGTLVAVPNFNNTNPAAPSNSYWDAAWQAAAGGPPTPVSIFVPQRQDLAYVGGIWGNKLDSAASLIHIGPYGNGALTSGAFAGVGVVSPHDAWIRNLRARISASGGQGVTESLRMWRDAGATQLGCVIPPGAPVADYSDPYNAVSVKLGELWTVETLLTGVTANAATVRNVSGEYVGTDNSSMIGWNGKGGSVAASTTKYAFLGSDQAGATRSQYEIRFNFACTLKSLMIRTSGNQPGTGSLVFTVYQNGSATGLTYTLAASGVAGIYTNLSNSVSVAAGDLITLQLVNNASGASATILHVTLNVYPTNQTVYPSIVSSYGNTTLTGSATGYANLFSNFFTSPGNTDEIAFPIPAPGTLADFYVQANTAGNAGSGWTFELWKNGSATGYKVVIGGNVSAGWYGATAGSPVTFAQDDLAWVLATHTGSSLTDPYYSLTFTWQPTVYF